jgi:hypothetical protein
VHIAVNNNNKRFYIGELRQYCETGQQNTHIGVDQQTDTEKILKKYKHLIGNKARKRLLLKSSNTNIYTARGYGKNTPEELD